MPDIKKEMSKTLTSSVQQKKKNCPNFLYSHPNPLFIVQILNILVRIQKINSNHPNFLVFLSE